MKRDYYLDVQIVVGMCFTISITIYLTILFISSIHELSTNPITIDEIKESAWLSCKTQSEERLHISHHNVQKFTPDDVVNLEEKNHYGVKIYADGHIYQCDLARRIDGEWFLKSLYVK
jgi:hypothetical protein